MSSARAPDVKNVSFFYIFNKNNVINNTRNNFILKRNICKVRRLWSNVLSGCFTNLTSLLSLNALSVWVLSEANLKMYFLIWGSGVCTMYKKIQKYWENLKQYTDLLIKQRNFIYFRILKEYAHIYTQSIVLERIEALQRVTLQNNNKKKLLGHNRMNR